MRRAGIWILLPACIAMVVATVMMWNKRDREAPLIHIPDTELSYTEGEDTAILMEGVWAEDRVDGRLNDRVFIYEIVPIEARGTALVVYAACDNSNNVGKAERMVTYERRRTNVRYNGGGAPMIRLKSYGTTLLKGELFDPHDYVVSLFDDKDSEEELSGTLTVKGNYDLTKTGHYRLQMYVTDSDGNESNRAEFLLVVE